MKKIYRSVAWLVALTLFPAAWAEGESPLDAEKRIQALEERLAAMEEATEKDEFDLEQAGVGKSFKLYGFYDLTFGRPFFKEGAPFAAQFSDKSSFIMSSVNLYLDSRFSETLQSLVELRLTFNPLGHTTDYEVIGDPSSQYQRVDTSYISPLTIEVFQVGGLAIERAHLTWRPREWFKVLAGRFLTPYGIWNTDHGPTVVIPILVPYLIRAAMVPRAQTGLQMFGRFFLWDSFMLDYALTLSNGRGPIESVMDLDDNKGLGLRLRALYENNDLSISLGGYAYYGDFTDNKLVYELGIGPDGRMDPEVDMPLKVNNEILNAYGEYVGSADFSLQAFGFLLQAEYIWRKIHYLVPTPVPVIEKMLAGGSVFDTSAVRADYTGWDFYVLAAYDIPVGHMTLTPYFMFERSDLNDTAPYYDLTIFQGGVNLRVTPSVVLKLEGMYSKPNSDVLGGYMYRVQTQLAVTY